MVKLPLFALPVALVLSTGPLAVAQTPDIPENPPRMAPRTEPPPAPVVTAPEFDGRSAGAAVAVLVGGALVLSSLRRRKTGEP